MRKAFYSLCVVIHAGVAIAEEFTEYEKAGAQLALAAVCRASYRYLQQRLNKAVGRVVGARVVLRWLPLCPPALETIIPMEPRSIMHEHSNWTT